MDGSGSGEAPGQFVKNLSAAFAECDMDRKKYITLSNKMWRLLLEHARASAEKNHIVLEFL